VKYTTLVNNGVEKVLADGSKNWPADHWGICADLELLTAAKTKGVVTLRTIEDFDAGTVQFAYKSKVVLWQDRDYSSGSFSGGSIWFQGYAGKPKRVASDGRQNIEYQFFDVWWLLERLTFKQTRNVFNGYSTPSDPRTTPTYVQVYTSEIYLGEKPDESYQTNGEQAVEILRWLNEVYNPTRKGATSGIDPSQDVLQIGTIDPAANIPKNRVLDPKCAGALFEILRWSPDAVPFLDYNTTPPTLHIRSLANLPEVVVNITADQEKQISVSPEYERQLGGVHIIYLKNATIDGVVWPVTSVDKYPPTINDFTEDVSTHTIQLSGSNITHMVQEVKVLSALDAASGSAATRKSFWLAAIKSVSDDPCVDISTLDTVDLNKENPSLPANTFVLMKDETGAAINLATYPNILLKGAVSDWMGVNWIDGTISANLTFKRYQDSTHKGQTAEVVCKISQRITFTNAVTRMNPNAYFATYGAAGEDTPAGLAQALYTSLATLQHSGVITFTREQLRSDISLGCKLRLVGPRNTYYNLMVQEVRARRNYGITIVRFGPSSVLDLPELLELARVNNRRAVQAMPSGRASGQGPGGIDVGLGTATAKENTQHGVASYKQFAVTAPA
jgi:hypothetical protein